MASVRRRLTSDSARFGALVGFIGLVALTGGGSRSDIQSLVILRPAAILFLVYALFCLDAEQARRVRMPLLVTLSLILIALLQLIPVPESVWMSLPNRDLVAEGTRLLGMDGLWRPLSLDPNRTWNTFFSLFVPLSAICLVAIQAEPYRRRIVALIIGVGLLSAVLGFLQAAGASDLRFYAITHDQSPVGLFANKNHQSVLLLALMIAASRLASTADPRRRSANVAVGGAVALIVALFPLVILTGSRAGLVLYPLALAVSGWLLLRAPASRSMLRRAGRRGKIVLAAIAATTVLPLLFVFGVLFLSDRRTALSKLLEEDATQELRWTYLPTFIEMARDYFPFGSGFGSFENAFRSYEISEMLTTRYVNQAHNDPAQFVIEGGLPALAVLAIALAWLGNSCWRLARKRQPAAVDAAVFFGGSVAIWLAASLVDYPLRTPLAAMLVAILTAQLSFLSSSVRSEPDQATGHGAVS